MDAISRVSLAATADHTSFRGSCALPLSASGVPLSSPSHYSLNYHCPHDFFLQSCSLAGSRAFARGPRSTHTSGLGNTCFLHSALAAMQASSLAHAMVFVCCNPKRTNKHGEEFVASASACATSTPGYCQFCPLHAEIQHHTTLVMVHTTQAARVTVFPREYHCQQKKIHDSFSGSSSTGE